MFDSSGAIYGTTEIGGTSNSGTVFQLTPPAGSGSWTYSVIHTFRGGTDGATPASTPVFDANGTLYATTWTGGTESCYQGCGTVFKLAPPSKGNSWTETVLTSLPNSGQNPNASVVVLRNGLLYGTTLYLGKANLGSVFSLVP